MNPRFFPRRPLTAVSWAAITSLAVASLAVLLLSPRLAAASTAQPPFPRIAIWWPDPDRQAVTDLADCDWIALQLQDADHIAALRAKNPDLVILGSTSARELYYDLGNYDSPANVELRSASTDWILTQLGSTLRADINASATSIPVADVTRFAVGEMVLVDHELMHIEAIGSSTLTVMKRGPVNPAAPHAAGARIASVVTHWPNSVSMDLSTNCPRADVGNGPETWSDWDVRRGRAAANSADWDGLLIDCLESNLSWMVVNGDVRSIDPLRTNTPVADGYLSFNAAWNSGAEAYGTALREAVGDRVLIGNGNLRNFALNGSIFEEFPYAGLSVTNWNTVFVGPYSAPRASYPEWCANAASPNLTMVQTYGAADDYRSMRYGLCSALMSDGYFSYARSSSGHARNGIDRFDEYDAAGAGRGYLGHPTGDAYKVGGVWRRDYEAGIALVNPTASPVSVSLDGTFRKIRGVQDPQVNDGRSVSSVTIPSRDGIILLRIPPMELRASTTTLPYGEQMTLQLTAPSMPGGGVRFEQRASGTTTWKRAATATVGAQGEATLPRAPVVTTEYRAVVGGAGFVSATVKVGVRPRVSIYASSTRVRRGATVRLKGWVTHPDRVQVVLQRYASGKWVTVRRLTSTAKGTYSTTVTPEHSRDYTYRAYVPSDASHLAAASGTVTITVR